jgi:hypothetical protein
MCEKTADHQPHLLIPRKALKIAMVLNLNGKTCAGQFIFAHYWATAKFVLTLFRIPNKSPAGSLRVLHAPARRGGIRRASKTKINNLETNEYASNLPFSKI